MQSRGGDGEGYHPTGRDLDDFRKWIRGADASQARADHFGDRLLVIYGEWLRARQREVEGWIPELLGSTHSAHSRSVIYYRAA